jgi:predicted DCC family thiol-disulfide oxidoreductase YuxK
MSRIFQTRSVLYDGGCRMCRRSLRLLHYLDLFRVVVPYDVANDWQRVETRFPHLDAATCMRDMQVITADGRTFAGYDGWRSLAWVLPLLWPVLPVLYFPPVRWLGWKVYRRIADNRCTSGCRLPTAEQSARSA